MIEVESFYEQNYRWLVRWCTAMTGNAAVAEDIVQDTFIRAMRHLDTLEDLSGEQCRAWLRRTAKNRYIDWLRHTRKESEMDVKESYLEDYTKRMVDELCMTLPPEESTLFVLRYFQGYNSSELGEMFHLSPSTVRARLASARRKLKKLYDAE